MIIRNILALTIMVGAFLRAKMRAIQSKIVQKQQ